MKIGLCQMSVSADKREDLRRAPELVAEAARQGADIVVLPEMFCCEYRNRAFVENCESAGGEVWQTLMRCARDNGIYLVGGSMPERDGDKIYNTCFVFDREGTQIARHRKMHLFDIDVPGRQAFKESKTFTAGDELTFFETEFGRMGLMICFDVRFPELARLLSLGGAQVIFCPAAFNMTTGPAHWELLHRGRAVENQLFTAACAPVQDPNGSYVSFGHSMVCSPWGDVLACADYDERVIVCEADLSLVEKTRAQLPLMSGRRPDIYTLKMNK